MSKAADLIARSQTNSGGVYFLPGVYPVLHVCDFKEQLSRKKDDLIIAEFEIIESDVAERPAGTKVSQVYNLTKHDAAPGNVKSFIAAVMGVRPDDLSPEEWAALSSAALDDKQVVGRVVKAQASIIKTRAGGDFTKVDFFPLGDDMQEAARELREAAGFPAF